MFNVVRKISKFCGMIGRENEAGKLPIGTQVVYNPKTETFILNTLTPENDKVFVEHGATASLAVVFADFIIQTENELISNGVHGFFVRLQCVHSKSGVQ